MSFKIKVKAKVKIEITCSEKHRVDGRFPASPRLRRTGSLRVCQLKESNNENE